MIKAIGEASLVLLHRLDERTESIDTRMELMQRDVAELLAHVKGSQVYALAAERGIPEASVRAIVERLGGQGIGRDDLIPWLENWIEAAARALARHSNEGEAFEAAWREAERRFNAGRIREASAAFMEELEREQRRETERQKEFNRRQIRLLEGAIRFDALAIDAPAIIQKLRRMAVVEGVSSPDALGDWLWARGIGSYKKGDREGSNPDLIVAIATFRAVLEEITRERAPLRWAAAQRNLGTALFGSGSERAGRRGLRRLWRPIVRRWRRIPAARAARLGCKFWQSRYRVDAHCKPATRLDDGRNSREPNRA